MNIEQEIININNKTKSPHNIIEDIKKEKNELDKKLHLFNIISFVDLIEKIYTDNFFQDYDIAYVKFNCEEVQHRGIIRGNDSQVKIGRIRFTLLDAEQKEQSGFYFQTDYTNPQKILEEFLEKMEVLKLDNLNDGFAEGLVETIKVDANLGQSVYKILLSNEIRSAFNYTTMNLLLPDNINVSSKKLKM